MKSKSYYSVIKDIHEFEVSLNDIKTPIILINKTDLTVLYWNEAYEYFIETYFNIKPRDYINANEYPTSIKDTLFKAVNILGNESIELTTQIEVQDRIYKTIITNSINYFIVFVDITNNRKMMKELLDKTEQIQLKTQANKRLLTKNIKLMSIAANYIFKIITVLTTIVVLSNLIYKDFILHNYETNEKIMLEFINNQNLIQSAIVDELRNVNEINNEHNIKIDSINSEFLKYIRIQQKQQTEVNEKIIKKINEIESW